MQPQWEHSLWGSMNSAMNSLLLVQLAEVVGMLASVRLSNSLSNCSRALTLHKLCISSEPALVKTPCETCVQCIRVRSVHWRNIMSTFENVHKTEGNHDSFGGYHEYTGGIFKTTRSVLI